MDHVYQTWLWVLAGGTVIGLVLSPRTVALASVGLFAAAVVGLLASSALGYANASMLFGIASVAIPILGTVATVGAAVAEKVRRARSK
jgi:hypothetical protein